MSIQAEYVKRGERFAEAEKSYAEAKHKYKDWLHLLIERRIDFMVKVAARANRKKSLLKAYPSGLDWLGKDNVRFVAIKTFEATWVKISYSYRNEKGHEEFDEFKFPLAWLSVGEWQFGSQIRNAIRAQRALLTYREAERQSQAQLKKVEELRKELDLVRERARQLEEKLALEEVA